jgi:hypothetical protein
MMGGHAARSYWEDIGLVMLVAGVLLGPLAWFLDLQVCYAMVKWACEHHRRPLILAVPIGSLALVAIATWMSWSSWTKLRRTADEQGAHMEDRSYFLAVAGLGLNAIFALLILLSFVPRYFLSPCE